jgi:hypothetical protein
MSDGTVWIAIAAIAAAPFFIFGLYLIGATL